MISEKQLNILAFPYTKYDALICDGAIRSGKTSIMTVAFIDWAMNNFNNINFAICGKTVGSATKNIISPFMAMSYAKNKYTMGFNRADNRLTVSRGQKTNTFYIYGGKDESSYMLIQGITLAGVLLDEVALMTRSFVEQALARCSIEGSKFMFNCNPASPEHWFYKEWVLKAKEKNGLHLHFVMQDNPSLSPKMLDRYENLYAGVFYDRYIKGLWVVAEGLIYPMFNRELHMAKTEPRAYEMYYASMDYGIQNPTAILLWGLCGGVWYAVKEYYHSGRETNRQKTDQEYYNDLVNFIGDLEIKKLIVDPSASSFIALCAQKKKFKVLNARNGVLEGISETATAIAGGLIKFNDNCENVVKEFHLYMWDKKSIDDKPLKENDHCMDALRYFVKTVNITKPKEKKNTLW